jgi:hypothetical protein
MAFRDRETHKPATAQRRCAVQPGSASPALGAPEENVERSVEHLVAKRREVADAVAADLAIGDDRQPPAPDVATIDAARESERPVAAP